MVKIKTRRPSSVARVSPPTRPLRRLLKPSCAQLHSFEYFIIIMVIMIIILIKIIVIYFITMIIHPLRRLLKPSCAQPTSASFFRFIIHYCGYYDHHSSLSSPFITPAPQAKLRKTWALFFKCMIVTVSIRIHSFSLLVSPIVSLGRQDCSL